nr:response regulator [Acidobacteriota bacterium]
ASPDALVVQYRLSGVDPGWVDAGTSRLAQYTTLPAGSHVFEVRARHRMGEWGPAAGITFRREASLWERPLVYLLAALLLLAVLLSAHRIRLRYWQGEASRHKRSAAQKEVVLAAVSERETRFSALLEHASDAIFLLDAEGRISYVSPSMERLTSRASEALLGRLLVDLTHPDDRASVAAALHSITSRPRSPTPFRYRVELPDVGWRTFSAIGRNLLDEQVVGGIIVNARDVTEQEEAEDLFRQAQKVDAIGNLAGGIAHDFNNLLAVISANASMVKDDLAELDVKVEGLDEIAHAAAGGERLTRQLLSFSKRQVTNPTVVDLNKIVQETVPMLRALLGASVEIAVEPSPASPHVYMDRGEVEQVIVNLVVNAQAAMPKGGTVTLTVAHEDGSRRDTHAHAGRGDYAILSVRDTGTGMDAETRARIFDPFFTTKRSGTGLGLATVAWIAKKATGFIEVESTPGEGTAFNVYLPVAGSPLPMAAAKADLRLAGITVLAVDDDDTVRKIAGRILRDAGAEVLEAESGQSALDVAAAHDRPIHLLLTDLVMPGMSGRELADRLVTMRPVCVLFMSGYTDGEITRTRTEGGDVGFLAKPFNPDSLVTAIEQALAGPSALAGLLQDPG